MKEHTITYLKDYKPPYYMVSNIYLTFELNKTHTIVTNTMDIYRNHEDKNQPLELNGILLNLISLHLNDNLMDSSRYKILDDKLIVEDVPDKFTLTIKNSINPQANKALEGLYISNNIFCTQNEPHGFQRITYYIDRPDNMAKFTTKIIADKKTCPVLLSNGDIVDNGELADGRHWAVWEDPYVKPSYLYALVAGDLEHIKDTFTTSSGKKVTLRIFGEKSNIHRFSFAMESLKQSMKWDQDRFGLEYDLDNYNIVAIDSFNMGAMENKGLNIFNSSCIVADVNTTTDWNFYNIQSIIGHEYFHNWTGNRVTCRDWFQLTLKEGLTVFRDQEFSSDLNSRDYSRIDMVDALRRGQFKEDSGPNAHPIQPKSYIEMSNFYTSTIYMKGAEVIRMLSLLIGSDGFKRGMDKYFELYDGMAVTTDEFIHAMSSANNIDLSHFKYWYDQVGTISIDVDWNYNYDEKSLTLIIKQTPSDKSKVKRPVYFPFKLGILNERGEEYQLKLYNNNSQPQLREGILRINKEVEKFTFEDIDKKYFLSLNRGFSVPAKVNVSYSNKDLLFLVENDRDQFNKFEASQKLYNRIMMSNLLGKPIDNQFLFACWNRVLTDNNCDPAIKAKLLLPTSETILHQEQNPINFQKTHMVRKDLIKSLAYFHKDTLLEKYHQLDNYSWDIGKWTYKQAGLRSLKNTYLYLLSYLEDSEISNICYQQFKNANNMSDRESSLIYLSLIEDAPEYKKALDNFYQQFKDNSLVLCIWFRVQAGSYRTDTFERIIELQGHKAYDQTIPNHVYSLIGRFTHNFIHFHNNSGSGYKFIADKIMELDNINPNIASGLSTAFGQYSKLPSNLKKIVKSCLENILKKKSLSDNVYEIVNKTLSN